MINKSVLKPFLISAFALSLFAPTSYAAKNDYLDLSPEQLLGTEVISVSRSSGTTFESPAAVYVITHEDIVRSGVTTIPDALRMAPGVQVARVGANSWAVSIRGFNATLANKLLVMIDGRTVYNPLHAGVYWEAHQLMLDNVERIEVIRGPGGTLWGANAVNGVINIITKNANETQGTYLSQGYGNHERGFVDGRHGGKISNDIFYRVYAKYFNRESFRDGNGESHNPDDADGYRGGFRIDWHGDSQNEATLQGNLYHTNTGQFGQGFSLTAPFSSLFEETAENSGGNLTGHWAHKFENGGQLSLRSFLDYTTRKEALLSDDRIIFDLESQYNFAQHGVHELVAGAGYRYMIDNLTGSTLSEFNPGSRKDPLYSAFLQDKITLIPDRWYLTLGAKVEQHHYTDFEFQPNARLQWFPDERQTVWASVSRAVRTPSRIERDLSLTNLVIPPGIFPLPAEVILINNKAFETEKMVAYELGYRNQITPDIGLDAAAFINNYHDLLSINALAASIAAGPPPHVEQPLIALNDMSAEAYGLELTADWRVNSAWKLAASYSYIEVYAHAPLLLGTNQETPEMATPAHQASLRSNWDINENWSLNTALYYVDEFRGPDVPAYVRLDANLGWRINEKVRFNLIGQNLFDDGDVEFDPNLVNTSQIETSVFGKLTWEF